MLQLLKDDEGAALITITWVVLLLSLLAVGVLSLSLTARQTVASLESETQNRLLAESAIDVFMGRYFFDDNNRAYLGAAVRILDENIRVDVEYDQGKIDINKSGREWISALVAASGRSEDTALSVADAIIDWRDIDDISGPLGAEKTEYEAADLDYGPRNAPFESVGELKHVLGMDAALYNCMLPLVTVYSKQSAVDIEFSLPPMREVAQWAYDYDWEGGDWKNPDENIYPPSYADAGEALPGQSLLLRVTLEDRLPIIVYRLNVRYKGAEIQYKRLGPLRLEMVENSIANCRWAS